MTLIYILPLYILAWFCARLCLRDPVLLEKSVSPAKYWQLDGLRFFLAFSVFLHHTFIIRGYVATGHWALTDDRVVTFLGEGGVSLFFIITAFLFWDKALKKPYDFDAVAFFIGRIRRLVPAYLVVAVPFLLLSLANLPILNWALFGDILRISSLGYFGTVDVGNLSLSPAYIGAFWTLFYEWKFYFLLPMLYVLLRLKNAWTIVAGIAGTILILSLISDSEISREWPYISLFASGILAATFYNSKYFDRINLSQLSLALVFISSLLLNLYSNYSYYGGDNPILFFLAFIVLLKIEKTSLLGKVLASQPTILLGNASYSMYVLHGFVISVISITLFSVLGQFDDSLFAIFCLISTAAVVFLSIAVYKYIELPYAFRRPLIQGVPPQ